MFYVDSIDDAVARVIESGGEITRPPYLEGDVRVARLRDPAGNALGMWQFTRA
jgi:predicted enzyme related to lactoylglutathione lyase